MSKVLRDTELAEIVRDALSDESGMEDEDACLAIVDLFLACRRVVDRWSPGDLAEAARACHKAVNLALERNHPPGEEM